MYLLNVKHNISSLITGIERPSANRKTGPMTQVWHIRNDMHPLEAARTGADEAICGNCSLRGIAGKKRTCYVTLAQAPTAIYHGLERAKPLKIHLLHNRDIRWGAYGDTALAVEAALVADVNKRARGWTGYTHQWKSCDQEFSRFLMASCDSEADYHAAKEAGWRTFRVKRPGDPVLSTERVCPASAEAGNRLTCIQCQLCNGTSSRKKDIVIDAHGMGAKYL